MNPSGKAGFMRFFGGDTAEHGSKQKLLFTTEKKYDILIISIL